MLSFLTDLQQIHVMGKIYGNLGGMWRWEAGSGWWVGNLGAGGEVGNMWMGIVMEVGGKIGCVVFGRGGM